MYGSPNVWCLRHQCWREECASRTHELDDQLLALPTRQKPTLSPLPSLPKSLRENQAIEQTLLIAEYSVRVENEELCSSIPDTTPLMKHVALTALSEKLRKFFDTTLTQLVHGGLLQRPITGDLEITVRIDQCRQVSDDTPTS